jgi:hypothetical protein
MVQARQSSATQPLPPRAAFLRALARTVVERAELLHEIAEAARGQGEQQSNIIVGGYSARFADELCPDIFRPKWPFPTHRRIGIRTDSTA